MILALTRVLRRWTYRLFELADDLNYRTELKQR
jgi:hypothetical protein